MGNFGGLIKTSFGLLMLALANLAAAQTATVPVLPKRTDSPEQRLTNSIEKPLSGQTTNPSVSYSIHGSVRGSQANLDATHRLANWLNERSLQNRLGIDWFGYIQQGVTFNPASPIDRTNGPVLPNYRSNAYQFNGLYLASEKKIHTERDRIQLGGRTDLIYGTDGAFNRSDGLDENISSGHRFYKLAIPQMYGNLFLPFGRGISFKFGKFFTPVGNEVKYNPNNFFYSYFQSFNLQPGNHTGVQGETELTERVHVRFGPNLGWNTSENSNHAISYAGDLRLQSFDKQTELRFAMQTGKQRTRIVSADSLVNIYSLTFQSRLNPRWQFLMEHDLLYSQSRSGVASDDFEAYSLATYLFHDINECCRAGLRFEWLRDDDGFLAVHDSVQSLGPATYYDITLGLNWQAKPHLKIRPEIRYDWQVRDDNTNSAAFDDRNSTEQWLFGCDVLWEF